MYTIEDVKTLRDATKARIMDCQKALKEANGDVKAAMKILQQKNMAVAAKRQDRTTSQGALFGGLNQGKTYGALLLLSCETDFVAKSDALIALGKELVEISVQNKFKTKEELLQHPYNSVAVADKIKESAGIFGEKVELEELHTLEGQCTGVYVHMGNTNGALISLNMPSNETLNQTARSLAVHVVASSPLVLKADQFPQEELNQQRETYKKEFVEQGKPAQVAQKIADNKIDKYKKENAMLEQPFFKQPEKTVSQFLAEIDNGLSINDFKKIKLK